MQKVPLQCASSHALLMDRPNASLTSCVECQPRGGGGGGGRGGGGGEAVRLFVPLDNALHPDNSFYVN